MPTGDTAVKKPTTEELVQATEEMRRIGFHAVTKEEAAQRLSAEDMLHGIANRETMHARLLEIGTPRALDAARGLERMETFAVCLHGLKSRATGGSICVRVSRMADTRDLPLMLLEKARELFSLAPVIGQEGDLMFLSETRLTDKQESLLDLVFHWRTTAGLADPYVVAP